MTETTTDFSALLEAYRATRYYVKLADTDVVCRIDQTVPVSLQAMLQQYGSACILTACNPQSRLLTADENAMRQQQLHTELRKKGYDVLPALAVADNNWPAEAGWLVFGIERQQAEMLAQEWQQYAYLWLQLKSPVQLVLSKLWNKANCKSSNNGKN